MVLQEAFLMLIEGSLCCRKQTFFFLSVFAEAQLMLRLVMLEV